MIGLSFKASTGYDKILYNILINVEIDKYYWNVCDECTEVFIKDTQGELTDSFFQNDILTGSEFLNDINRERYYLSMLDIKAFRNRKDIQDIDTLEQFLESSCEIVIFCIDGKYFEFYCKNIDLLECVKNNCKVFGYEDVNVVTLNNMPRKIFHVM